MSQNLYVIKSRTSTKAVSSFSNKAAAKAERQRLNKEAGFDEVALQKAGDPVFLDTRNFPYTISRGKDHPKGASQNGIHA